MNELITATTWSLQLTIDLTSRIMIKKTFRRTFLRNVRDIGGNEMEEFVVRKPMQQIQLGMDKNV